MTDVSTISASPETTSTLDLEQLLDNLGRFPARVLPLGIMRELQSRGNAIHDSLANLVWQAVHSMGKLPIADSDSLFCFCSARTNGKL